MCNTHKCLFLCIIFLSYKFTDELVLCLSVCVWNLYSTGISTGKPFFIFGLCLLLGGFVLITPEGV